MYYPTESGWCWAVLTKSTCPDTTPFPKHLYRNYEFPDEKFDLVFKKLIEIKEKFTKEKIVPTKENQEKVFPTLEELLGD